MCVENVVQKNLRIDLNAIYQKKTVHEKFDLDKLLHLEF